MTVDEIEDEVVHSENEKNMTAGKQVKTRVAVLAALLVAVLPARSQKPAAQDILRDARLNQSEQHRVLRGRLRHASDSIPFRLVMDGSEIRYEFSEPEQVLRLRLGEKVSRLEEITRKGSERVTEARFDKLVRNTDISYEDLTLHFLYWADAEMLGRDSQLLRPCWKLRVRPPSKKESQYASLDLWIEEHGGVLMQADAFDAAGKLVKRFKVISAQKLEGMWLLKQMRIESMEAAKGRDKTPTYLEIQGIDQ